MAALVAPLPITSCIPDHMTDAQQESVSADLPKLQPAVPVRKPKLSLQTTSLTGAYGSLSRGIAPNTAQTTYTPTTTNTLSNQWDLSIRPSPISRTESPRPLSTKQQLPYTLTLPFGVRSILKNSPLPRQASVSASPRDSRRKVFFPQPKKVTFRSNLEDAIETRNYVARHVDLSSSDEDSSSEGTTSSSQNNSDDELPEYPSPPPSRKRKSRRENLTSAETPVQDQDSDLQSEHAKEGGSLKNSHSCKRRKWQWTIPEPIPPSSEESDSIPQIDPPASFDPSNSEDTDSIPQTQTDQDGEFKQDQESTHLASSKACIDSNRCGDLGSPPDVWKRESEDMGSEVTCQRQGCGHKEDKNS